jgi:SSS family solute:Na+ symporter
MSGMQIAGIIVIALYCFILIFISWNTARKDKSIAATGKSFFLGRGIGLFVMVFSLLAAAFTSWVIMGCPTTTYTTGWQWVGMVTLYQITFSFTCGYLGPRMWKLRQSYDYVTHGDLVSHYYDSKIARYCVGFSYFMSTTFTTIAQFVAIGNSAHAVTGIPYVAIVIFIALVIILYVCISGFQGTAFVDCFQGIVFSAVIFGGFLIVLFKLGGLGNLFNEVAAVDVRYILYNGNRPDTLWPTATAISFCMVGIFGGITTPAFWLRYYAADKPQTLIKMSVRQPILASLVVSTMGGIVGLSAHAFIARGDAAISNANTVFQTLLEQISSPYWPLLILVGVMAAGMSSIAGNCHIGSMVVTYDIISKVKPDLTEKQLSKVAKTFVIALTMAICYMSINTTDAITTIIVIGGGFAATVIFPILGIFIWRRATTAGVVAAMLGSLIAQIITNFVVRNPLGIIPGGWGLIAGSVLFIVISLCTKPIPAEKRAAYMLPLSKNKQFEHTTVC